MTSFTFDSAVIFMKVPGHDASEMSIAVDHKMMALDAIRWEETWGERKIEQAAQAQHLGNRLLSIEGRKIAPNEILHEVLSQSASGCVTLSDYSQLGPSAMQICSIGATEFRGITVVQLEALLDFVKDMAPYWYETFGPAAGQALAFETFNLYHANNWIILPSTQGRGGRDAWVSPWMMEIHKGCSYVELVSREAEAQRPQWFVSHAWKEPIVNFVACLRKHLTVRDLGRESPYWVCAYANNQHRVDEEIPEDPRESAFFRAMKVSDGVLLILDTHATPFTRIWCCFEESVAVEERDSSGALLLDLATASADAKDASLVTDGLAGVETQMMPLLGMLAKSQREASFPAEIMQRGLEVDIKQAQAAVAEDKNRILNSIVSRHPDAVSRVTGKDLALQPPPSHESYDLVNRALASHFSLSSWFGFMMKGHNCQNLMEAISADQGRQMVQLSMTGCFSFKDSDLQSLVQCLPEKLRVLRLDLAFTGLDSPFDGSLEFPSSLEQLVLRFAGSLQSIEGLPAMLFPLKLSRLELWLCNLPALSTIGPLGDAIKRSRPGELVLQLNGCPQLSLAIKEDLHRSLQDVLLWARVKRHVHIEDVSSAWSCLRRRADAVPERTLTVEDPSQSFCSDTEIEMMLPYPCSQAGCKEFHPNEHGFCSRHRHSRFFWKVRPTLRLAWQAGELALLFSIQALFEARSRFVLVFFGLSLYPVLCMMMADSMGLSFGLTFSTTLLVVLASMAYTSGRFDSMRGAMQRLCLAMEASYFQVLHTTGLSQLFEEVGVLETLRQDVQDLKSNFMEARRCRGLFQKVICDPLSVEGVVKAKLKLPTEIGTFPGAECSVDLLYCEVICQNMSSLRRSWCILKDLVASNNLGQVDRNGDEVDVDLDVDLDDLGVSTTATCPLKIMAVRDDFVAFRGRPCGRVVVSIDGYLATVMFLEAKLSRLDAELGDVCHLAEKVGLLDDVKPQNWGAVKVRVAETSRFRRSMLLCVRWLAATCAGFFCQGHFRLAMNAQQSSELSLPKEILAVLFSLPFLVLLLAFMRDIFFPQQEHDLCSTMVVYEKYLGAQGRYYISKVAIVQIGSVCLQALGRLRVFGAMVILRRTSDYGGYLAIHEVDGPEVVYYWDYWAFIGLLLVNLTYPNVLFFFPHKQWARLGASFMDLFLDISYLCTFNLVFFWSGPAFAFPTYVFGYMANYMSIARMFAVCRSLDRVKAPSRTEMVKAKARRRWTKRLFPWYSISVFCLLLAFVWSLEVYPMWRPSSGPDQCLPCRCTRTEAGLHLENCDLLVTVGEVHAHLKGRGISTIGVGALNSIKTMLTLNLEENRLMSLPSGMLTGLSQLKHIYAGKNPLSKVPPDLFSGLTKLERIDLAWNQLGSLPAGLFQGLPNLRVILLQYNRLSELPPDLFSGLTKLEVLELWMNQLTSLPSDLFNGLTSLDMVHLAWNQLGSLPAGLFQGLPNLRVIILKYNWLSELPPDLFSGLTKLELLELWMNQLTSLPSDLFNGLTTLDRIDLAWNQLGSLPAGLFQGLPNLRDILLKGNRLSELPPDLFSGLTKLEFLELWDNQLTSLPSDLFNGLTTLDTVELMSNQLGSLPAGLFQGLPNLRVIKLQHNRLSELPPDLFSGLTKLELLELWDNQLTALPSGFFSEVTKLRQLGLNNNTLTLLPFGTFEGLALLKSLDLSHNQLSLLPSDFCDTLTSLEYLNLAYNKLSSSVKCETNIINILFTPQDP